MPEFNQNAGVEELVAEIRDKIRKARESATRASRIQPLDEGSIRASIESLDRANEDVRSTAARLGELPPTPPTLRGRIGRLLIRSVAKLLWWQQRRLVEFAEAEAARNVEAFRHFLALMRSVRELEAAQLKLQSDQIDALTVRDLARIEERCDRLAAQLSRLAAELGTKAEANEIGRLSEAIAGLDGGLNEISQRLESTIAETQALKAASLAHDGRLAALDSASAAQDARLAALDSAKAAHEARLFVLERELEGLRSVAARLSFLDTFNHQTRTQTSLLDRRLSTLIEEMRGNRSDAPTPAPASAAHQFDASYLAFEDAFRGTRDEIKTRQAVYIPILKDHGIGGREMPVLDIGCGRGEWLELLRDHELCGRGVDQNQMMLEECRNWELDVVEGEALSHLANLPAKSLGAVTGFHIIEHMPFPSIVALFDECLRVLKPGGMVIFETPNPGNFHVATQNFYTDPTHLKPLPSAMIRFFAEARGFCDARIMELHPYPSSMLLPDDPYGIGQRLNGYLYGPQDYAILGHRA